MTRDKLLIAYAALCAVLFAGVVLFGDLSGDALMAVSTPLIGSAGFALGRVPGVPGEKAPE